MKKIEVKTDSETVWQAFGISSERKEEITDNVLELIKSKGDDGITTGELIHHAVNEIAKTDCERLYLLFLIGRLYEVTSVFNAGMTAISKILVSLAKPDENDLN